MPWQPISRGMKNQQVLLNKTPKYGNDDEYADAILTDLFNAFYR